MANRARRTKSKVLTPVTPTAVLAPESPTGWGPAGSRLLPDLPSHLENRIAGLKADVRWHGNAKPMSAVEKQTFVRVLAATKMSFTRACGEIGFEAHTVKAHAARDPDFAAAIEAASESFIEEIELKNREMALQDKGVADRIFLLKAVKPDRYSEKATVIHGHISVKTPAIR